MPLDKSQLSIVEKELDRQYVALLEEVLEELANSEDREYVELIGRSPTDNGEASMGDLLAALDSSLFDRHIKQLRAIEAASTRMREDVFGICAECGADIRFERLMAYPATRRCASCQQQRDHIFSHQATSSM